MQIPDRVMKLAVNSESRFNERNTVRRQRLQQADQGNVWAADDPERVAKRLAHVQAVEQRAMSPAMLAERALAPSAGDVNSLVTMLAQERTIGRDDLVAPQFLRLALAASRCVCRISVRGASGGLLGYGTGMLVGPGILLTNNHVLESAEDAARSEATFGFETGSTTPSEESLLRFQPQRLFITDEELDFTFVAVAAADTRGRPIERLGYLSLNQAEGKAINGEYVNVIQHPNGGPKMFALRENRIVDVLANFLHYAADTAPGSSGAPVFNDQFEMVALHHSGVPARDGQGNVLNRDGKIWTSEQGETAVQWKANEGVRVSVLVGRAKSLAKTAEAQDLLAKACDMAHSIPQLELGTPPSRFDRIGWTGAAPAISGNVATWTIPLSVSVGLGGMTPDLHGQSGPNGTDRPPPASYLRPTGPSGPAPSSGELTRAVEQARDAFRSIPGVLRVRTGWQFADGWITDKAAIVVVVEEKRTTAALADAGIPKLPGVFGGFPVDVRQASAEELYELGRIGGGMALEERTAHPTYAKPAHLSLPRIRERMKVRIHVSPEYGWPVLKEFLENTKHQLTVAMYDFGAPHIVDAITARLAQEDAKMKLVIQYGSSLDNKTKAHDLDDSKTVERLEEALGQGFSMQWANVSQKNSLWASAYHIKVAVQDSQSIWLSSGNWQSSNQAPDTPPGDDRSQKALLTNYNREWHALIDNPTLAKVFESYIDYDFKQSKGFTPKGAGEAYEILPPLAFDEREAAPEIRTFEPLDIDREVDLQPVLTPDNYVEVVLPLIESAESRLYFQNQYINESLDERAADSYIPLLKAIAKKQQDGLDVRIILRGDTGVEARHIEFMKSNGIDMTRVHWRNRTHTKGIVVDSSRVLLGSHNWSYDGTVLNRDASLLFYDREIAQYLEKIFIYDWENWSKSRISIRQTKPKVQEISSPQELAALKGEVTNGKVEVRRLFHPDD